MKRKVPVKKSTIGGVGSKKAEKTRKKAEFPVGGHWIGRPARIKDETRIAAIRRMRDFSGGPRLYRAPDVGEKVWFFAGPDNVGGRVTSLALDDVNGNLYAGAACGGVWKSTDEGKHWRPLWDDDMFGSLAVGALLFSGGTLYAGTGEWAPPEDPLAVFPDDPTFPGDGLYYSSDNGSTWYHPISTGVKRVTKLIAVGGKIYIGAREGLFSCYTDGSGLTQISAEPITDVVSDPNAADTLYACIHRKGVNRFTLEGTVWSKTYIGFMDDESLEPGWQKVAAKSVTIGVTQVTFLCVKGGDAIWRGGYDDGAGKWVWQSLVLNPGPLTLPDKPWASILAVGGVTIAGGPEVRRTGDDLFDPASTVSNWSGLLADSSGRVLRNVHAAAFGATGIYVADDDGIVHSVDGGATWTAVNRGLSVSQFLGVSCWNELGTVLGGGLFGQGAAVTRGGLRWRKFPVASAGTTGNGFSIGAPDVWTLYASMNGSGVWKLTDPTPGAPWSQVKADTQVHDFQVHAGAPNRLFAGSAAKVCRSDDGGASWSEPYDFGSGEVVIAVATAPGNADRVYAATKGKIAVSADGGVTWVPVTYAGFPSSLRLTCIAVSQNDDEVIAAGFEGEGGCKVFFNDAAGADANWKDVTGDLIQGAGIKALAFDPVGTDTLYAGTDSGVVKAVSVSTAGPVLWQDFGAGLPTVPVSGLAVSSDGMQLFASTFGRGVYKVRLDRNTTAAIDLFLRNNVLDTGERIPPPYNLGDPEVMGSYPGFWMSPDIKVRMDASSKSTAEDEVLTDADYDLDDFQEENPKQGVTCRVYVQVHNRGYAEATDVKVRVFFTGFSSTLPPFPDVISYPDMNPGGTDWESVGTPVTIPIIPPNSSKIVSWDYSVSSAALPHSCFFAVISNDTEQIQIQCPEQVPDNLSRGTKLAAHKNYNVTQVSSGGGGPTGSGGSSGSGTGSGFKKVSELVKVHVRLRATPVKLAVDPLPIRGASIEVLLTAVNIVGKEGKVVSFPPLKVGLKFKRFKYRSPGLSRRSSKPPRLVKVITFNPEMIDRALRRSGVGKAADVKSFNALVTMTIPYGLPAGTVVQCSVVQKEGESVTGGCTFGFRYVKARGKPGIIGKTAGKRRSGPNRVFKR